MIIVFSATGSGTDATVPVTITVNDVGDVYPVCQQYFLATGVAENTAPVSTNVGAPISCTPANGLTYQSTDPNYAFSGTQMIVATGTTHYVC